MSDFKAKMHKIRFRWGSAPEHVSTNVTSALEVFLNDMRYINPRFTYLLTYPLGELTALPRPPSCISWGLLLRGERGKKKGGEEAKER